MNDQYIKNLPADWVPAAQVFAAIGDPMRQKILLLFEPGEELSIKEIVELFPLSRTAIVHHLAVLERAGVISSRKDGKLALYQLEAAVVLEAVERLRDYILSEFPENELRKKQGR